MWHFSGPVWLVFLFSAGPFLSLPRERISLARLPNPRSLGLHTGSFEEQDFFLGRSHTCKIVDFAPGFVKSGEEPDLLGMVSSGLTEHAHSMWKKRVGLG